MVKKSSLETIEYIDTGEVNWNNIINNFINLSNTINTNADELLAVAQRNTCSIVYAIEKRGYTTIINPSKHYRSKILNAWAMVCDNIEMDSNIKIADISDNLYFNKEEQTGTLKIFTLKKKHLIFHEEVKVYADTDRRFLIGLTIESREI